VRAIGRGREACHGAAYATAGARGARSTAAATPRRAEGAGRPDGGADSACGQRHVRTRYRTAFIPLGDPD